MKTTIITLTLVLLISGPVAAQDNLMNQLRILGYIMNHCNHNHVVDHVIRSCIQEGSRAGDRVIARIGRNEINRAELDRCMAANLSGSRQQQRLDAVGLERCLR